MRTKDAYVRRRFKGSTFKSSTFKSSTFSVPGSRFEPAELARLDAAHQVFFHIDGVRRQADGEQPPGLARLDRAELLVEPQRARALPGRAIEQRAGRHGRRQGAQRRELGEEVEVRTAG